MMPGRPGNVDMSAGIELRDVPTGRIDRSQGDIHAYGDPHYHLSPANAQRMAATLVRAMAEADPANADFYRQNAKRFVIEMADLHRSLKEKLSPYEGLKVVTYHKAWDYFVEAFGIDVVVNVEPKPAITPSPADVRRLINAMKEQDVKVVVVETYSDHGQANSIARQAGATAIVLPDHVHGVRVADSYQSLFRYNVEKLVEAAKAGGVEPTRLGKATTDAR